MSISAHYQARVPFPPHCRRPVQTCKHPKAAIEEEGGGGKDTSQEAPEGNADRAQGLGHRLRNSQAQPLAPPHQLPLPTPKAGISIRLGFAPT